MRQLPLSLISLGLLFSLNAWAADHDQVPNATVQAADLPAEIVQRPAIVKFVPFPQVDPLTQKALKDGDSISIGGKTYKAKEFYDALNKREKELNALGYSLHDASALETIAKIPVDMNPILQAAGYQTAINLTDDESIMKPIQAVKDLKERVKKDLKETEDSILRGFEALANGDGDASFPIKLGPLDKGVKMSPETDSFGDNTHKEWAFGPENQQQIGVRGKAVFHLGSKKTKGEFLASAQVDGRLLQQDFNILAAKAQAKGELSFPEDKAKAALGAEVYLNVLGMERFKWSDKKEVWTYSKPDLLMDKKKREEGVKVAEASGNAADTSKGAAPGSTFLPPKADGTKQEKGNALDSSIAVTREGLKLEPWAYPVSQKYVWYFMVGPVPGNGAIGVDGSAFIDWGTAVDISGAKGTVKFGANVSVWASGAIGVEILQAGVYANLTLVESGFDFDASAKLSINDGPDKDKPVSALWEAYQQKSPIEPKITTELKGTRHLTFLKGRVGAFAEVPVPTTKPPFIEQKRFENSLFNWDGYTVNGKIFSFKKVHSLGTYNVFGAESKDDQDSTQLDKDLDDHFRSVLEDGPTQALVLEKAGKTIEAQDAVRKEMIDFIENAKH